ncbi:hypothetical protein DJ031_06790 [bacterium endosymbiont of Escarpia laminata]|nr:MAG: hypothetical protein DJ031_06790 [bacterium endosymbiont of Escarpia laminata]
MKKIIYILIPRFLTEEVAMIKMDGEYHPVCSAKDLDEYDHYDRIVKVRAFNFFGFGLFPRVVYDEEKPTAKPTRLPCQFCGGEDLVEVTMFCEDWEGDCIECRDCRAQAPVSVWQNRIIKPTA